MGSQNPQLDGDPVTTRGGSTAKDGRQEPPDNSAAELLQVGSETVATVNRRRILGFTSIACTAILAGCTGGETGGESPTTTTANQTPSPTASPTATQSATPTEESKTAPQQAVVDDVEGLDITEHSGSITEDNYSVTVVVENTGGQKTNIEEYDFRARLYNADGEDITGAGMLIWGQEGELAPGGQTEVRVESTVKDGSEPEDVERYQVRMKCGSFSEGVYCNS